MKAIILAAGIGTRLEPLTLAVPKPMVPILNKPIMLHNLELLKKYGIRQMIANLHYFPEQIENYFMSGTRFGIKIAYSYEEQLMGTAGGVRRIGRELNNFKDTFVVLSSDALTDINLRELIKFHKEKKALATIALKEVSDPSQFGIVILNDQSKVVAFQEKPEPGTEPARGGLGNAGIYVFEPQVLDMIPDGKFYDFGKQLFPLMAESQLPIFGFKMDGYWSDIGSLKQYKQSHLDALAKKIKLNLGKTVGSGSKIEVDAILEKNTYLGNRVKIGRNVVVKNGTVLGDTTILRRGTQISDTLVWAETIIGENCKIKSSIIGSWCYLEENVEIGEGSIIANRCRIKAGRHLPPNTILAPDQVV